jgi:hypothetical protein
MSAKPDLTLSDWNWAVLMLTQAMIGAVSPNFRLVELAFESDTWVVRVSLSEESAVDREEIADLCDEFLNNLANVRHLLSPKADTEAVPDVIITQDIIILSPTSPTRYVFRMRED